jgi:O-acetyl-ADP-ribose deacetylase (regulator of RNase III)
LLTAKTGLVHSRRILSIQWFGGKTMRLYLVDADETVAFALREAFRSFPEVSVSHADLLAVAQNTVVSPANAYGFMDGGIDAAFRNFFGAAVEGRVREAIGRRPEGYLPIGASLVVQTGNARIPHMIVAPTMLAPEAIDSQNCYRAMRAVLRIAAAQEKVGRAVFCPGLGTGVGQVLPAEAAREMAQAYGDWKKAAEPINGLPCQ